MAQITINEGQCLPDIALQYCGSLEWLMDICALNGISPTGELTPGARLFVPDVASPVLAYLRKKGAVVACAADAVIEAASGIGYWAIGDDFIVS